MPLDYGTASCREEMVRDINAQRSWRRHAMPPHSTRAGLLMPYTQQVRKAAPWCRFVTCGRGEGSRSGSHGSVVLSAANTCMAFWVAAPLDGPQKPRGGRRGKG